MKKWLLILLTLVVAAIVAIYVFIPATLKVSKVKQVAANPVGTIPFLQSAEGLARWWPGTVQKELRYRGCLFTVGKRLQRGSEIDVEIDGTHFTTLLELVPHKVESLDIIWATTLTAGSTPWTRLQTYRKAGGIKQVMSELCDSLRNFLEKQENIYGLTVQRSKIKDTLLVTLEQTFADYPGTKEVYGLVQAVEAHIQAAGVQATNVPMLSIIPEDSLHYRTMVAIPVSKIVPATERFGIRRMVPGNVLITSVKGGPARIQLALRQLDAYRNDYEFTPPAKPFQSLITNRLAQPDSSKWITGLYWPVF